MMDANVEFTKDDIKKLKDGVNEEDKFFRLSEINENKNGVTTECLEHTQNS